MVAMLTFTAESRTGRKWIIDTTLGEPHFVVHDTDGHVFAVDIKDGDAGIALCVANLAESIDECSKRRTPIPRLIDIVIGQSEAMFDIEQELEITVRQIAGPTATAAPTSKTDADDQDPF